MASSAKLAIPRSGVQKLDLVNGLPDKRQQITFAAWQAPEKGTPKRVVVRIDGNITNQLSPGGGGGLPCGMVNVRYTIGGYVREVLIDATNQSALTLWAESVDVTAVWDTRRINRVGGNQFICLGQQVAASVSACECGDTGAADARWLDALALDETTGDPEAPDTFLDWSIHPIPQGARGLRFLDGYIGDNNVISVPGATETILWSADTFDQFPNGFIQANTNGATDTSILIVPPCARFLFLSFLHGDEFFSDLVVPTFIEWIIAPNTLPGF